MLTALGRDQRGVGAVGAAIACSEFRWPER